MRRRRRRSYNNYVLYPEYFDASLSRKEGRRIAQSKAVERPTLAKLEFIARHLKLNYTSEEDKSYSRQWWDQKGRLLVEIEKSEDEDKTPLISKTELIEKIARLARRVVSKSTPEEEEESTVTVRQRRRTESAKSRRQSSDQ